MTTTKPARILKLITPHTKGPDVTVLQRLLTHSQYGDFHPGGVDGEFGQLTGAAVYRAKYWLGYLHPNQATAGTLQEYLGGVKSLTLAMRALRTLRLRKQKAKRAAMSIGERVVVAARTQLGTEEHPPGSNLQPYGAFWKENGVAWCALFALWALVKGGYKISVNDAHLWGYVPRIHADAIANRGWFLVGTSNIRAGDIVGLYHDEHTEVFDHWISRSGPPGTWTLRTCGGNTTAVGASGGNPADGGHVADPIRTWADVSFAARKK